MNIVLFDASEIGGDGSVVVSDVRALHLLSVLRVTPGQEVRVGVIDGPSGIGTVTDVGSDQVTMRCALEATVPNRPRVDLLLALPRPKVMRRLWAQLAALGVGRVMLTNAEKVERDYFDTHLLRPEGFRPLLIEGLQQARDTRMPLVTVHKQFRKLLESELAVLCLEEHRIVAHPDGNGCTVGDALIGIGHGDVSPPRVVLAVGPEGGWNAFEIQLLTTHGFTPVSLGPRPLATTTACVALLTLVHASLRAPASSHTIEISNGRGSTGQGPQ
ncbi:MAG: RsmE family RNA methyltransferase [Acidobacteria bacterium]|nr:RsmE family RNA methyltransferase [Acidobacteriota bacterium]